MSLSDRAQLLRLKGLRAERAAASLATAQAAVDTKARAQRMARIALETRRGIEARISARTYRDIVNQPVRAAGFDAVDGALIALSDATTEARRAADTAARALTAACATRDDARAAAIKADRACQVWTRLAEDARKKALLSDCRAEDAAMEAAVETGILSGGGVKP